MKRPTPITASAVSRAKAIAKPIVSRLASDGFKRRPRREYACAAMGDEATGTADGPSTRRRGSTGPGSRPGSPRTCRGRSCRCAFERISGGHSNLTYRVTDAAGRRWALRRPPLGKRLGSAHDMGREHKVVSALGPTPVPVAPVVGLCEDESVNGAPFYVMEFVEGPILRGLAEAEAFPDEARPAGDRRAGRRHAGRDPRGRPRRGRARRPRPQGGLRRPPAAPLARPVGEVEDARAGGDRRRARAARGAHPRAGPGDDRPRRLPARQHDPLAERRGRGGASTGSCARSATRSPTSAC